MALLTKSNPRSRLLENLNQKRAVLEAADAKRAEAESEYVVGSLELLDHLAAVQASLLEDRRGLISAASHEARMLARGEATDLDAFESALQANPHLWES